MGFLIGKIYAASLNDNVADKPMKEKTCKVCRVKFIPLKPLQAVCGLRCAQSYAWRVKTKTEVAQAKAERKEIRAKRESIKTRAQWMREAQQAVNAYVRIRDDKEPCISCGRLSRWAISRRTLPINRLKPCAHGSTCQISTNNVCHATHTCTAI